MCVFLVWEIKLVYGNAFSHLALALALVNDSVLLVHNTWCLDNWRYAIPLLIVCLWNISTTRASARTNLLVALQH